MRKKLGKVYVLFAVNNNLFAFYLFTTFLLLVALLHHQRKQGMQGNRVRLLYKLSQFHLFCIFFVMWYLVIFLGWVRKKVTICALHHFLRRFCKKALLYAVCRCRRCRCRRCRLLHVKFQEWEEPKFKEPPIF